MLTMSYVLCSIQLFNFFLRAQLDCTNVIAIVIIIFLVFLLCPRRPFIILYLFSIIQKASNALEVLREVLDAVDGQRPEV